MKKTIFRLTLPLTLISFGIITKWSYGIVVDGTDEFFYGFPLIYKCDGFHTSLSTQYFLTEMVINLLTYFTFWLIITCTINRFWKINIPKLISKIFWIGFGVLFLGFLYLSNDLDDRYKMKRDFDVKMFDSGITIFGIHSTDREKYQTENRNKMDTITERFSIGDYNFSIDRKKSIIEISENKIINLTIKANENVFDKFCEKDDFEFSYGLYPPEFYAREIDLGQKRNIIIKEKNQNNHEIALYFMEHNHVNVNLSIHNNWVLILGWTYINEKKYPLEIRIRK